MEYIIKIIIDNISLVMPKIQIHIKDFYELVEVVGYSVFTILCIYRFYKTVFQEFMETRLLNVDDLKKFQRKYFFEIVFVLGIIEFWRTFMNDIIKF